MKKLLFLICALFMVGISQAQTPPTTQTQQQSKVWKIGDVYNVNGKKGVVFTVSPDGQHGVIISMNMHKGTWNEAKTWCASLGGGWRMPTVHELLLIYAVKNTLNEVLYWVKGAPLYYRTWSSNSYEGDSSRAWNVRMNDGLTSFGNKDSSYYVRAVSAF